MNQCLVNKLLATTIIIHATKTTLVVIGLWMKSLAWTGCKEETTLGNMASHAHNAEQKPKTEVDTAIVTGSDWYKAEFEGSSTTSSNVKHTVQVC